MSPTMSIFIKGASSSGDERRSRKIQEMMRRQGRQDSLARATTRDGEQSPCRSIPLGLPRSHQQQQQQLQHSHRHDDGEDSHQHYHNVRYHQHDVNSNNHPRRRRRSNQRQQNHRRRHVDQQQQQQQMQISYLSRRRITSSSCSSSRKSSKSSKSIDRPALTATTSTTSPGGGNSTTCNSYSVCSSSSLLSLLAWSMTLLLVSSCLGIADAGTLMGHPFSKRSFMDIQCKGVYDKSLFARLDRICEDCYNLFREPQLHTLCRKNCFTSDYFKGCLDVLLLQDEMEWIQTSIKQLHGADPGV